ncbi:MAG: FHA domain-containing protein [Sandaracinaceae bacterium]|nr:FHA domain-containing protein [Sandaracinaceae bacterium]
MQEHGSLWSLTKTPSGTFNTGPEETVGDQGERAAERQLFRGLARDIPQAAEEPMFAVVITEKGGAQRRLDFDKNEVTIGRVQGNDIILPKGNVSKRHSRIVLKDNRFIVVDLKSTNGTYVNGRKITSPLVVKSGDKIYIGDFILTLEEGAGAGGFDAAQASPAPGGPPRCPDRRA